MNRIHLIIIFYFVANVDLKVIRYNFNTKESINLVQIPVLLQFVKTNNDTTKSLNQMRMLTLLFSALLTCTVMAQSVKMRKEGAINVEVSYRMEQLCDYPNQWRNSDWREEFTLMLELSDGQAHSYVVEVQRTLLSTLAQFQQENSWNLQPEPIAHLGETFVKGKTLEQIVNLDAAGVYRYTESVPKQKWKVCEEKKKILDYECQRATCSFRGRDYEAWFAEDIPMSYGPWKFNGLPGLILEVSDTKNEYHFTVKKNGD